MLLGMNKLMALTVLALSFSMPALAQVGFATGNNFIAVSAAGDITLTCNAEARPARTVSFQCRDTILVPTEYDSFRGPAGVQADTVELIALHDDGTSRAKAVSYDSSHGASKVKFNLWVNSFLQSPLLAYGENRVTYRLRTRGVIVNEGLFVSNVKVGGLNQCPSAEYYSNSDLDCDQPYTYCQRFFQDKNFCQ